MSETKEATNNTTNTTNTNNTTNNTNNTNNTTNNTNILKLSDDYTSNDTKVIDYFTLLRSISNFESIYFPKLINPLIQRKIKYDSKKNLCYLYVENQWIQVSKHKVLCKVSEIIGNEIFRYINSLEDSNSYKPQFNIDKKKYLNILHKAFSKSSDTKFLEKYWENNKLYFV
jgi:hypothetical protein